MRMLFFMSEKKIDRGPAEGKVRMTFDMLAEDRDALRVFAALASQAEKRTVTMGDLLNRWAKEAMAEAEQPSRHAKPSPKPKPR